MASTVHLIRHGEVENPRRTVYADLPGFHLSGRGRRQAAWAADRLAARPIEAVYSSPLDRAAETAAEIAGRRGLASETVPGLTEWALMGRWRGLPWPDLNTHRPGELDVYLNRPLEMDFTPETVEELAVRVGGAVSALAERHPAGEIAAVSHQDAIQSALLLLTGAGLHRLHEAKPRHCEIITLAAGNPWTVTARRAPGL